MRKDGQLFPCTSRYEVHHSVVQQCCPPLCSSLKDLDTEQVLHMPGAVICRTVLSFVEPGHERHAPNVSKTGSGRMPATDAGLCTHISERIACKIYARFVRALWKATDHRSPSATWYTGRQRPSTKMGRLCTGRPPGYICPDKLRQGKTKIYI